MIVTYNNFNDCKKRLQNLKKFKLNNQYNSFLSSNTEEYIPNIVALISLKLNFCVTNLSISSNLPAK